MTHAVVVLENGIGAALTIVTVMGEEPPVLAGRYELRQLLGRGSHGVVCRAFDRRMAREVALKLFPAPADSHVHLEVQREAQTLAQLRHPNIVDVYDFETVAGQLESYPDPFGLLSMQLVVGQNLRSWLKGASGHSEIRRVLADAAEGLAAAHAAGVTHRDFKPENIIVDDVGHVHVVDFGLARAREAGGAGEHADPHKTTAAGTPAYMAPEASRGTVDARTDQFALGVCIVESLTRQEADERPALDLLDEGVALLPRGLKTAVAKATRSSVEERFDSVLPLIKALRGSAWKRKLPWAVVGAVLSLTILVSVVGQGPPSECVGVEGQWAFETDVVWSENPRFADTHGRYELEMKRIDGCVFHAAIKMTGERENPYLYELNFSSRVEVVEGEAGPQTDIDAMLVSTKPDGAPRRRAFDFTFGADGLYGDWSALTRSGNAEVMRGVLRGARQ